jgi:4-hydroxybenzoate polyprenyltransferase
MLKKFKAKKFSALMFLFFFGCIVLGYLGSQESGRKLAAYLGAGMFLAGGIVQIQELQEKKKEEQQAKIAARMQNEQ